MPSKPISLFRGHVRINTDKFKPFSFLDLIWAFLAAGFLSAIVFILLPLLTVVRAGELAPRRRLEGEDKAFPLTTFDLYETQPEGLRCNLQTPVIIYNELERAICYGDKKTIQALLETAHPSYSRTSLFRALQISQSQANLQIGLLFDKISHSSEQIQFVQVQTTKAGGRTVSGTLIEVLTQHHPHDLEEFIRTENVVFITEQHDAILEGEATLVALTGLYNAALNHIMKPSLFNEFSIYLLNNFFELESQSNYFLLNKKRFVDFLYDLQKERVNPQILSDEYKNFPMASDEVFTRLVKKNPSLSSATMKEIQAITFDDHHPNTEEARVFLRLFNLEDSQRILRFIMETPAKNAIFSKYIQHPDFNRYYPDFVIAKFLKNNPNIPSQYKKLLEEHLRAQESQNNLIKGQKRKPAEASPPQSHAHSHSENSFIGHYLIAGAIVALSIYLVAKKYSKKPAVLKKTEITKKEKKPRKSRKHNINVLASPIEELSSIFESNAFLKDFLTWGINENSITVTVKGDGEYLLNAKEKICFDRKKLFHQLETWNPKALAITQIDHENCSIQFSLNKKPERHEVSLLLNRLIELKNQIDYDLRETLKSYEKEHESINLKIQSYPNESLLLLNKHNSAINNFIETYQIFQNSDNLEEREQYLSIYKESFQERFDKINSNYNQIKGEIEGILNAINNLNSKPFIKLNEIPYPETIEEIPNYLQSLNDRLKEHQDHQQLCSLLNELSQKLAELKKPDGLEALQQLGSDFTQQCTAAYEKQNACEDEVLFSDEEEKLENLPAAQEEILEEEKKNEKIDPGYDVNEANWIPLPPKEDYRAVNISYNKKQQNSEKAIKNILQINQKSQLSVLRQYFQRLQACVLFDVEKNSALGKFIIPATLYSWFKFTHVLSGLIHHLQEKNINCEGMRLFTNDEPRNIRNFLRHIPQFKINIFYFFNDKESTKELIQIFQNSLKTLELYITQLENHGRCNWQEMNCLNFKFEELFRDYKNIKNYNLEEIIQNSFRRLNELSLLYKQSPLNKKNILLEQDAFAGAVKMMMLIITDALIELKKSNKKLYQEYLEKLHQIPTIAHYTHQFAHGYGERDQITTNLVGNELQRIIMDLHSQEIKLVLENLPAQEALSQLTSAAREGYRNNNFSTYSHIIITEAKEQPAP